MTETIIMRGAYVITDPRLGASGVIQAGAVVIADGTIRETGPFAAIAPKYPDTGVIGDGTQLLMPGLVDAHSHGRGLSQSMARTSSAKSDVVSTTGSAIERRPPPNALHVVGNHQKVSHVAREAVNGRGDDNIAGPSILGGRQLLLGIICANPASRLEESEGCRGAGLVHSRFPRSVSVVRQ
jgi:predicted amidohydrolase YtcJ